MTYVMKTEWEYSGRMARGGKARKQMKQVRKEKVKDTKR